MWHEGVNRIYLRMGISGGLFVNAVSVKGGEFPD
jgi:hypothetical protein